MRATTGSGLGGSAGWICALGAGATGGATGLGIVGARAWGAGRVFFFASCDTREAKKNTLPAPQALAPTIPRPVAPPVAPAPKAQIQPAEPPKPEPVVALIAESEIAYQSGL